MFLGIGGKVGPTIARMAKRAAPSQRTNHRSGAVLR